MKRIQAPGNAPQPMLSPNHVEQTLRTVSETVITIRNAAKCSKISASAREQWRLADEAELVGRQLFALSETLRREAR